MLFERLNFGMLSIKKGLKKLSPFNKIYKSN